MRDQTRTRPERAPFGIPVCRGSSRRLRPLLAALGLVLLLAAAPRGAVADFTLAPIDWGTYEQSSTGVRLIPGTYVGQGGILTTRTYTAFLVFELSGVTETIVDLKLSGSVVTSDPLSNSGYSRYSYMTLDISGNGTGVFVTVDNGVFRYPPPIGPNFLVDLGNSAVTAANAARLGSGTFRLSFSGRGYAEEGASRVVGDLSAVLLVQTVPEPSTLTLLSIASILVALGAGWRRGRDRQDDSRVHPR